MANDKLSARYLETVKGVPRDQTVTALVRTKAPEPDRKALEQVLSMARAEHLATRRSDLLQGVTRRYGEGAAFCANLKDATTEAQARVAESAPQAHHLWLANAVAVRGTRQEIEDLAGHEDVISVEPNPDFRVPEILRTPLEDTPN